MSDNPFKILNEIPLIATDAFADTQQKKAKKHV